MKKYLISIESEDSKRLQGFYAQKTFYKYKDDFKQFGIIGKNLTVSEYFEQGVAGKEKPMTPGELGCTLSHLAALKDFLSSEEAYAVIFEDDVIERFEIDFDVLEEQIRVTELDSPLFLSLGGIQMKICRKVKGKQQSSQLFGQSVLKVDPLDFHKPPRVYDQWADLIMVSKQPFSIYVSYIFDHPQIENEKDKSYLENERDMMSIPKKKSYSNFSYIIKKIRGFFLQTYKLSI